MKYSFRNSYIVNSKFILDIYPILIPQVVDNSLRQFDIREYFREPTVSTRSLSGCSDASLAARDYSSVSGRRRFRIGKIVQQVIFQY